MPWTNGPVTLYHGCDQNAAQSIRATGVSLNHCNPLTDFGQGFYTTTSLIQAKNWANMRCGLRGGVVTSAPAILQYDVDRDVIARLDFLCFVTDKTNSDYWDLVAHCRSGKPPHARTPGPPRYDVVFGGVSLWPQVPLTIADCDQISFHTPRALGILPSPKVLVAPSGSFFPIP